MAKPYPGDSLIAGKISGVEKMPVQVNTDIMFGVKKDANSLCKTT
jgi:hypothetical protein